MSAIPHILLNGWLVWDPRSGRIRASANVHFMENVSGFHNTKKEANMINIPTSKFDTNTWIIDTATGGNKESKNMCTQSSTAEKQWVLSKNTETGAEESLVETFNGQEGCERTVSGDNTIRRSTSSNKHVAEPDQLATMFEECSLVYYALMDGDLSLDKALNGPEQVNWKQAIEEEINGLKEKGAFLAEPCPENTKPLETRCVLTKKIAPDGKLEWNGWTPVVGSSFSMGTRESGRARKPVQRASGYACLNVAATGCNRSLMLRSTGERNQLEGRLDKLQKAIQGRGKTERCWSGTEGWGTPRKRRNNS